MINDRRHQKDLHKKILKAYLNSFRRSHNIPEQLEELILSFAFYSPFVSKAFYQAIYFKTKIKIFDSPCNIELELAKPPILQQGGQYKIGNQIILVQKIWTSSNNQRQFVNFLFSNFPESIYHSSWLQNNQLTNFWKYFTRSLHQISPNDINSLNRLRKSQIIMFYLGQKYRRKQKIYLIDSGVFIQNVGQIIYDKNAHLWILKSNDSQIIWKKQKKFNRMPKLIYDQLSTPNICFCYGSNQYVVEMINY